MYQARQRMWNMWQRYTKPDKECKTCDRDIPSQTKNVIKYMTEMNQSDVHNSVCYSNKDSQDFRNFSSLDVFSSLEGLVSPHWILGMMREVEGKSDDFFGSASI